MGRHCRPGPVTKARPLDIRHCWDRQLKSLVRRFRILQREEKSISWPANLAHPFRGPFKNISKQRQLSMIPRLLWVKSAPFIGPRCKFCSKVRLLSLGKGLSEKSCAQQRPQVNQKWQRIMPSVLCFTPLNVPFP